MTAKQQLLERVESFSEEEAEDALALLFDDFDGDPAFPPAPPRVMALAGDAIEQSHRGEGMSDEEFGRRFSLD